MVLIGLHQLSFYEPEDL